MSIKKNINTAFIISLSLGILLRLILLFVSPINGNDVGILTVVIIVTIIQVALSLIGAILGIIIIKPQIDELLTVKRAILLILVIASIINLVYSLLTIMGLVTFLLYSIL